MKKFVPLIIVVLLFSCKKTSSPLVIDLHNTNWNLFYKYDGFSFYAQTDLRFHDDTTFENIGVADTVDGTWKIENDTIKLKFDNAALFRGVAITIDSLSGTMYNALTNGVWHAIRR